MHGETGSRKGLGETMTIKKKNLEQQDGRQILPKLLGVFFTF